MTLATLRYSNVFTKIKNLIIVIILNLFALASCKDSTLDVLNIIITSNFQELSQDKFAILMRLRACCNALIVKL